MRIHAMANEEEKIIARINYFECQLKMCELSEKDLKCSLTHCKELSMNISTQLEITQWKITQADFVHNYETKRYKNYVNKINFWKEPVSDVNSESDSYERIRQQIYNLREKLRLLKEANKEKEKEINTSRAHLTNVKKAKHNLLTLMDTMKSVEKRERELEDLFEQVESECLSD